MDARLAPTPAGIPQAQVDYMAMHARHDAEAVSLFLKLCGIPKELPLVLDSVLLLATGLRLKFWEHLGFDKLLKGKLPSGDVMLRKGIKALFQPMKVNPKDLAAAHEVLKVQQSQFAWSAPRMLGAEVVVRVGDFDDDHLVETLARFIIDQTPVMEVSNEAAQAQ